MKATFEKYGPLGARILLALIFVVAGWAKLVDPSATAKYIASKGLPLAEALAIAACLLEIGGGLLIMLGLRARWAAAALAIYLVPVTIIFHNPSGLHGMAAQMAMTQVMKNLSIIGGLVMVAVFGSGALSLDSVVARLLERRRGAVQPE